MKNAILVTGGTGYIGGQMLHPYVGDILPFWTPTVSLEVGIERLIKNELTWESNKYA
ncbi:MAG: hypothetical protein NXI01_04085 [Gammaproteobacteria bacterium]|nr:hypothetical protein [Gammaproteobacteria bacterium]